MGVSVIEGDVVVTTNVADAVSPLTLPATVTVYVPGAAVVATVNWAPALIVPPVMVHTPLEIIVGPGALVTYVAGGAHVSVVKYPPPEMPTTVPTGPEEVVRVICGPVTVKLVVAESAPGLPVTVTE